MTNDLAKPGEPYVSPKGTMFVKNEEDRESIKQADRFVPVIKSMVIRNRFNVNELPANDINEQHVINAILVYQLHGLTVQEIAYALKIEPTVVQNLMHGSDYQVTFENIFRELISVNSNSIRSKIAAYAETAISNVITLAEEGKNEKARLLANQDLLDRAGYAPEQMYGRDGNKNQDEDDILKIVVENGDANKVEVSLDLKGVRR